MGIMVVGEQVVVEKVVVMVMMKDAVAIDSMQVMFVFEVEMTSKVIV